jgi:hypothetical protein
LHQRHHLVDTEDAKAAPCLRCRESLHHQACYDAFMSLQGEVVSPSFVAWQGH